MPDDPTHDTGTAPAPGHHTQNGAEPASDFETRWRERLAQNAATGEALGIDPSAGESYEGYAGRFDGDYDITLPSGRYLFRKPGYARKNYSVRYMPDPASPTNTQQIGTVAHQRDIMPMVRRHADRHADKRDPLTVGLSEHEQKALDEVADGTILRFLGQWYRHNQKDAATQRTTRALWTLSALGLIQVPPPDPDRPDDRCFAQLSALGEQRHRAPRGEPEADTPQRDVQEQPTLFAMAQPEPAPAPSQGTSGTQLAAANDALPPYSQARRRDLDDIARGNNVGADDAGPPETVLDAAPAAAGEAELAAAQTPDQPVAPAIASPSAASDVPARPAVDSARIPGHAAASPTETTPTASEAQEEPPAAERDASAEQATLEADDRAHKTAREVGTRSHPQPGAARQEGTAATSAPPTSPAAEQPVAPDSSADAGPYLDADAYTAAHQALLRELDQHEQWLSDTPAASRAAAALADTDTLSIPGLTDLLTLQSVLGTDTDSRSQRAQLAEQVRSHVHRAQLTLAQIFHDQAARTTDRAMLRDLHRQAFHGQFIDFVQQTEDGEMELGQYIQHRGQQVTQRPVGTPDSTDPTPETAREPTMAMDPDDDIQLPAFELPGEILMTEEEAAPRLLAEAQARVAGGAAEVALLAHIHGCPVYALVDHQDEAPVLMLGLTRVDKAGSARAVTLPAVDLDTVDAQTLLAAVTAWMNASDGGGRPVLDYGPAAPAAALSHPASAEAAPVPAAPAPPLAEQDTAQEAAVPPAPAAPDPVTATEKAENKGSDSPAPQPAAASPTAADQEAVHEPATGPAETTHAATETDAEARSGKEQQDQHSAGHTSPAGPPGPAPADPVDQLTALARSTLTDLGVTLRATGVLTADRTVVITLETTGNADRDRELVDRLRPVLREAIRQHSEKSLAAYRVDFQHTPQVGQDALPDDASGAQGGVPRERLIAVNHAAAQIFAERLREDPNAELSRTYLSDERQLPAEVQQEWGLGYAPSDRSAGRWDLLTRELMAQGFSENELLHAGLATTSSRGTLVDAFWDRIMFPIHDANQDIVGFSGRRVDRPGETKEQAEERGGPKYFNTSNDADLFNKSELVFGLHHPAQAETLAGSSGPRVSVEGYLDVIAVARAAATLPIAQRPVAGAPMGTAFTERQLAVLRGLDTDDPRPHIVFLDADESGRKVLLNKWNLLVEAAGPTTVTTAPDAKDAAKLWEEGAAADGDGAAPVLRALEQRQPLLDATVEAVLMKNADDSERANHAFDSTRFFPRTRAIAAEAARYIHQAIQAEAPGSTTALEQAALSWAKRLDHEWKIPGHMTATAVLLGPGTHDQDYENEVYEQALDLLAADPEGYFANDSHVRSRQSAAEATSVPAAAPSPEGAESPARRPGQWPAGTRASGPFAETSPLTDEPASSRQQLMLSLSLPSPVKGRPEVQHTDRTTAAYALQTAVHDRLGQHTIESPDPDRLPQPLKLGTVHGVDLSTSGDDQTSDDPTVVVWLGTSRSDSLRISYSRLIDMSGPELLAAIEWRAAQAAGLLGTPLSRTWRDAVRSILPRAFPAQPTPAQLADLLDTIAQGPDGTEEHTRRRAEQALSAYTAGYPNLALDVLAPDDHVWVLRNDGSWDQEEAIQQTWEDLENGFRREAAELDDITRAAGKLPADEKPVAADLSAAHDSAHEAVAALGPYSIGLPNTLFEKITDLVAQMEVGEPALRRLHGPGGEQLMHRAKRCVVRILEGLATAASKIRLTSLGDRLEYALARLRGQDPGEQTVPRAVCIDRRMQDLFQSERELERRMATPTTPAERGELQEKWIINRARWRARYEQLAGQPPDGEFLPDNDLIAGAPPVPNPITAHEQLLDRLAIRVAELRDTNLHTGESKNPYEPRADLLNGVAWAYQQRLIGAVPTGDDPQGPPSPAQLRQAAQIVTERQNASPLTLRREIKVTAEQADRLLHHLEKHQILGPYQANAPRTVLARTADIDTLLARPTTPNDPRAPYTAPDPAPTTKSPATAPAADASQADVDERVMTRLRELLSKMHADAEKRRVTGGESDPADGTAPASRARPDLHKTAYQEAADNALAAGQPTSLAPSKP